MAVAPEEQLESGAVRRDRLRPEFAGLAGVFAALTAGVVVFLLSRLSQGGFWVPVAAWLVAGAVAGTMLRRRQPAMGVAVITCVLAGLTAGGVRVVQADMESRNAWVRSMAPPTVSEVSLATLACALACVVGAAAAQELQRVWYLHRRRQRALRG
ncbi:MAG: hypothetical protein HUU35_09475 [Armatimonadetes bacterium]|nr:hypothetical protein [Armatimonadota bacterium]